MVATNTQKRFGLFMQMMVVLAVSLLAAKLLGGAVVTGGGQNGQDSKAESIVESHLNGATLKVEPALGNPTPLDSPIQGGARGQADTQASDELQQPRQNLQQQSSQNLQPGVGNEDLPADFEL